MTKNSKLAITPASYFQVNKPNVIIDCVKMTENSSDSPSIIVRLYEALGGRGPVTLTWNAFSFASVARCNILEDELVEETKALRVTDTSATFDVTPFKIVTLKLQLKKQ